MITYPGGNVDFRSVILVILFAVTSFSCTEETSRNRTGSLDPFPTDDPTEATYLSGRKFCSVYSNVTRAEHGKFVKVPKDYNNPNAGMTEIYAWTVRPFNPNLPTAVLIDGGPGGNSHGNPQILDSKWNELHFDQRGLGCSSLERLEDYMNPRFFSTDYIVLDMDEVRKDFGLSTWSLFGSSYGTLPATMYASKFPNSTKAVVLEGTVFDAHDIHNPEWKVSKYNEVFSRLTDAQIQEFEDLLQTPRWRQLFAFYLNEVVYSNKGFRKLLTFFNNAISPSGKADLNFLSKTEERLNQWSNSPYPQAPQAIDTQIHRIIFCKELGDMHNITDWDYNLETNRFFTFRRQTDPAEKCISRGVNFSDETPFVASQYPIRVPVTYFQGSHDGATLARGAIKHWQSVPQTSAVNFLLRTKGGHGPNLSNIVFPDNPTLKNLSIELMIEGLSGLKVDSSLVTRINGELPAEDRWVLYYTPPGNMREIDEIMDGIFYRTGSD
jgi:proline iminopeptidase